MKITKKRLVEIIKQEILEFTTTAGGTAATKRKTASTKDVATKKADVATKKKTRDTKRVAKTAKQSAYDTKVSAYNTHIGNEPVKYQSVKKGNPTRTSNNNRDRRPVGYGPWTTRSEWTSWNSDKSTKLAQRNTSLSDKNTADSEESTASSDYDSAVDALSAAQKAAQALGAETSFAVSAGGGGRKGGKGGTGKKGKGKSDESLFRILGRDLISELKDIEKYNK